MTSLNLIKARGGCGIRPICDAGTAYLDQRSPEAPELRRGDLRRETMDAATVSARRNYFPALPSAAFCNNLGRLAGVSVKLLDCEQTTGREVPGVTCAPSTNPNPFTTSVTRLPFSVHGYAGTTGAAYS